MTKKCNPNLEYQGLKDFSEWFKNEMNDDVLCLIGKYAGLTLKLRQNGDIASPRWKTERGDILFLRKRHWLPVIPLKVSHWKLLKTEKLLSLANTCARLRCLMVDGATFTHSDGWDALYKKFLDLFLKTKARFENQISRLDGLHGISDFLLHRNARVLSLRRSDVERQVARNIAKADYVFEAIQTPSLFCDLLP